MAVKPITNRQAVTKEQVNRAEQRSFRNYKNRSTNRAQAVIPGKDFTKNYAVTLKDVDTSVMNHIKHVISPAIREAGETVKVPILYGNQERWVAARKSGAMRDKNGSIILPAIMLRRTDVAKTTTIQQSFKHDVKGDLVNVIRSSKWSKHNRYDRFAVQTNKIPMYENILTGPADFVDITYEFMIWSNYMEQMNSLVEMFVEQNDTYWGNVTDYKFLCSIDSFADASEMDVAGERFIKNTFTGIFKGYLLSEVVASVITNKKFQVKRELTPSKVVFGTEIAGVGASSLGGVSSEIASQAQGSQKRATTNPVAGPRGAKSALGASITTEIAGGPTGQQ